MKLSTMLFIASHAAGVYSAAASSKAAECGALEVMDVDPSTLEAGVDVAGLRKCANHPNGAIKHGDSALNKRTCAWESTGGCDDGWCWKSCGGPGEWCWLAKDGGYGDWQECKSNYDCMNLPGNVACGKGCKNGDDCGCSC